MTRASEAAAPDLARTSEGRAAEVERLIAPSLSAMGYDIVRVILSGSRRPRLQIMAERQDLSGMTVDDCAEVSRAVSALLDVEDPIAGPFELEVSSPGIDRPLTRLSDFQRFAGREAKVEIAAPIDGRRRWTGRLLGIAEDQVRLATEAGEFSLPFGQIVRAKLLLNDKLIAASHGTRRPSNQGTE